ncbi:23S rRNA (guanine(745)-N(1))-methyltransferase [Celerinatantimonas sp. YJH-8]|uniref:23S rRNA (guanine(745)-N(1))-methyltransferase n=1 Tax=Celerinatantimonas sp. YJH-8 TaxID=3228714 RepID=UPI0038CA8D0B
MPSILSCPICQQPLTLHDQSWKCTHQHSFDQAKEGYINLLPVQFKHSKTPGDAQNMVDARKQFLAQGHYHPLLEHIQYWLKEHHSAIDNLLDIGCGEGYYTRHLNSLAKQVWGLDIAKTAIKKAAKADPFGKYIVASSHHLPIQNQSIDLISRIFAPLYVPEILRCLKPNGIVMSVVPGPRHLWQLRELIYDDVRLHDDTAVTIKGMQCIANYPLSYTMPLSPQERQWLMTMTPFAWKLDDESRLKFTESERSVEAEFNLQFYQFSN